jgi:diguanylate cyclase (GGDEF)-like protein
MADAEPLLALLGRLLTAALAADRTQDRSTKAMLREQLHAESDALTGLPNRRAWQRLVERTQARYDQLADPTVIAVCDLDRLKIINDSQGHAAGDAHLITAAAAMRRALRDSDTVARIGGNEFAFILHNCTLDDATTIVARIYAELHDVGVEGSIGWTVVTAPDGLSGAIEKADAAMYATKLEHRKRSPSTFVTQVTTAAPTAPS